VKSEGTLTSRCATFFCPPGRSPIKAESRRENKKRSERVPILRKAGFDLSPLDKKAQRTYGSRIKRQNGNLVVDILEPHRPDQDDTFAKAKGLAEYADAHGAELGKAMMLKIDGKGEDAEISGCDVTDRATREKVLATRSNEEIQGLFQPLGF
jgi:hypothetical protein